MRHELYVTASLAAASMFVALTTAGVATPWPALIGFGVGFATRGATIQWKLALPPHQGT